MSNPQLPSAAELPRAARGRRVLRRAFPRAPLAAVLCAAAAFSALAGQARADGASAGKVVSLAQALKRTVMLFPFDVPKEVPNQYDVSQLLTDVAQSRMEASGQYTVIVYNRNLPPVARLHLDQVLTDADVAPPFSDDTAKALKVTKAVGYDVAFVGAVDEYTYNQADNQVTMVLRGQMMDAKTGKQVGAPVILTATSSKGGTAKEPAKALEAARDGGSQLMQKLVPITNIPVPPPSAETNKAKPAPGEGSHRRGNNTALFGILAIGLGLGIALASGGGHHSSNTTSP